MDAQGDNGQFTKRVTLPSGKTIEVVYFADEGFLPDPASPVQPHAEPPTGVTEHVQIEDTASFVIHPGEFVLGSTVEWVELPDDIVARIEGKSSLGRLGLIVHATAGFVDPGFSGTLTLEITNLTRVPIILWPGKPIAQLSFMALDQAAERPYGHPDLGSHYHGQLEATESRYEGGPAEASPTKPETA